jgi:hypothetical protein
LSREKYYVELDSDDSGGSEDDIRAGAVDDHQAPEVHADLRAGWEVRAERLGEQREEVSVPEGRFGNDAFEHLSNVRAGCRLIGFGARLLIRHVDDNCVKLHRDGAGWRVNGRGTS